MPTVILISIPPVLEEAFDPSRGAPTRSSSQLLFFICGIRTFSQPRSKHPHTPVVPADKLSTPLLTFTLLAPK